jgi:protein TonB
MAFEAYLQQDSAQPRRGRRLMYVVSGVVHAAAVVAAVAYSYWHVEEVKPPQVTVTLLSAAAMPPPPPPPPPLGGGSVAPKHKSVVRPKVELPRPNEVVQPKEPDKETPKEAPKEEPKTVAAPAGAGEPTGVKGGVVHGVKDGVVGGTVGGPGPPISSPPRVTMLPPQMGAQQKLSGAMPDLPGVLSRAGATYLVMAKICVGVSGAVDTVTLMKRAEPTLDNNVIAAVKAWRFRPLMANGTPAPFCYFGRFDFKAE